MLCSKCKLEKPIDEYNWRNKSKGIRHKHCRDCQRRYKRNFYEKTSQEYKRSVLASNASILERNQNWVLDYLRTHPCVRCGVDDPIVLEFDHVRGTKSCEISRLVSNKVSVRRLEEEVTKCEVVCANCHRVRTAERGGHYRWRKGDPFRHPPEALLRHFNQ